MDLIVFLQPAVGIERARPAGVVHRTGATRTPEKPAGPIAIIHNLSILGGAGLPEFTHHF